MFKTIKKWIRKYVMGVRTWEEAVENCTRPDQVAWRAFQNLFPSKRKSLTDVKEIWNTGEANEEEFSRVVAELCKRVGIEVQILKSGQKYVATGTFNGKIWFSYAGGYEEVKKIEDLADAIGKAKIPKGIEFNDMKQGWPETIRR